MNRTTWFVDKNGTRRYVNDNKTVHRRYNYRYTWSDGKCLLQGREVTFTHAAASNPTSSSFENRYRYEDRLFDVSSEIGSASCRVRVCQYVYISLVAVSLKNKPLSYIRFRYTFCTLIHCTDS